jgi:hypothetical protein
MKSRFLLVLVAALAAVVAAFAAPVSAQTQGRFQHHPHVIVIDGKRAVLGSPGTLASAGRPDPEFSPLSAFAARIQELGQSRYASTFAGVQLADSARVLDVYVVPRHDYLAFLRAVAATDTRGLPYTVYKVTNSYATQAATTRWVTAQWVTLRREGILLNSWSPSPADDAVLVALQRPAARQLAELRNAVAQLRAGHMAGRPLQLPEGTVVSRNTYVSVAAAVLNAEAPPPGDIVVSPAFEQAFHAVDGSADNTPFFGGDLIWFTLNNTFVCTSDFSVNSATNTSVQYAVTAGHCSGFPPVTGRNFYTCFTKNSSNKCDYFMGTVNNAFWNNNDDFELIFMPSGRSVLGLVWINRTSNTWAVNGFFTPAVGNAVTSDPWPSAAIFDNNVDAVNGCFTEFNSAGTASHKVCSDIIISKNGASPCNRVGDSGGPILERESDGTHIDAVGVIVASNSSQCAGELITRVRSEANVRLIFG